MRDPAKAGPLRGFRHRGRGATGGCALDVTDAAGAQSCVDAVVDSYGRIDILVNNAGRGSVASLEQLTRPTCRPSWTSTIWALPRSPGWYCRTCAAPAGVASSR